MTDLDEMLADIGAEPPSPSVDVEQAARERLRAAMSIATATNGRRFNPATPRRRRHRLLIGSGAVAVIAAAAGTAAALGVFDREARIAFGANRGACPSDVSAPARMVAAQLPGGGTAELWIAVEHRDGQVQGVCNAVLFSDPGEQIAPDKALNVPGAGWIGAAGIDFDGDRPTNWVDAGAGGLWIAHTGEYFEVDMGIAGDAASVEYRLGNGQVISATVDNGWYLIVVPQAVLAPSFEIVARDRAGTQIGVVRRTWH